MNTLTSSWSSGFFSSGYAVCVMTVCFFVFLVDFVAGLRADGGIAAVSRQPREEQAPTYI